MSFLIKCDRCGAVNTSCSHAGWGWVGGSVRSSSDNLKEVPLLAPGDLTYLHGRGRDYDTHICPACVGEIRAQFGKNQMEP